MLPYLPSTGWVTDFAEPDGDASDDASDDASEWPTGLEPTGQDAKASARRGATASRLITA